jgi:hypothetical protein
MSDERFEQEEAKDEDDVEAHKRHSMARNVEATDEPADEPGKDDESDDVEAHARRASHKNL